MRLHQSHRNTDIILFSFFDWKNLFHNYSSQFHIFHQFSGFEGNWCQWTFWSILQAESFTSWSQSKKYSYISLAYFVTPIKTINICSLQSYRLRTRTVPKTTDPEFNETLTFYGITDNDILTQSLHILILGMLLLLLLLSLKLL